MVLLNKREKTKYATNLVFFGPDVKHYQRPRLLVVLFQGPFVIIDEFLKQMLEIELPEG